MEGFRHWAPVTPALLVLLQGLLHLLYELFDEFGFVGGHIYLSFLRPPVGVQVLGSIAKRVYHIQIIKAVITLNNYITYRCVSCMHIYRARNLERSQGVVCIEVTRAG